MVDIQPFQALIFNASKVQDLSLVVSPPYDVIDNSLKESLKKSSPFNIVNLILPEAGGKKDKYANASEILAEWVRQEILIRDAGKNIYVFEEKYLQDGMQKNIIGIVGLVKIEDYEKKAVLRHEKTLYKHRQDRLDLLRRCRTNFGLIYTLFEDADRTVHGIIQEKVHFEPELFLVPDYDKDLSFRIWRISKEEDILRICDTMKDKSLLIADGHHRYETSRLYRDESGSRDPLCPENYVMTLMMDIRQEDIALLPTHRFLTFQKPVRIEDVKKQLQGHFELISLEGKGPAPAQQAFRMMEEASAQGQKRFLFVFSDGRFLVAILKKDISDIVSVRDDIDRTYEDLDVNILHKLIIDDLLAGFGTPVISFTPDAENLSGLVRKGGSFTMGAIIHAPDKKEVLALSLHDRLMPQKSTYFYPKPCSGLLMYRFDD